MILFDCDKTQNKEQTDLINEKISQIKKKSHLRKQFYWLGSYDGREYYYVNNKICISKFDETTLKSLYIVKLTENNISDFQSIIDDGYTVNDFTTWINLTVKYHNGVNRRSAEFTDKKISDVIKLIKSFDKIQSKRNKLIHCTQRNNNVGEILHIETERTLYPVKKWVYILLITQYNQHMLYYYEEQSLFIHLIQKLIETVKNIFVKK